MSFDFWEKVFSNLGFEKTEVLGEKAFKIPIYEAIYMSQVIGYPFTREEDKFNKNAPKVKILTKNKEILRFPSSCPSVSIKDIFLKIGFWEKMPTFWDEQPNPLLSSSLNFLKMKVPEFFDSQEKYLIFENEKKILEEIEKNNLNPADFVIFKPGYYSERHYSNFVDESVIEFITSSFLRKEGFIVDKFCPFITQGADLVAFKIPEVQNKLSELKLITGGFYLNELELLNFIGKRELAQEITETKSIVIEAESPTSSARFSQGYAQLKEKYLPFGFYDEGYVAIAFEEERLKIINKYDLGLITLTKEGKLIISKCPINYGKREMVDRLLKDVERIIKLILLKNLPLKEIFTLLPHVHSFYDLYFEVDDLSIEKIVEFIETKNN